MSYKDFNNGLVTGLSLSGVMPYIERYQPIKITNDDAESITIDFGIDIGDFRWLDNVDAFHIFTGFIDDHYSIKVNSVEKINDTTLKFHVDNYFACNGVIFISYEPELGKLQVPAFTTYFYPVKVAKMLRSNDKLDELIETVVTKINQIYEDSLDCDLITATYNTLTDYIQQSVTITYTDLITDVEDSSENITLSIT